VIRSDPGPLSMIRTTGLGSRSCSCAHTSPESRIICDLSASHKRPEAHRGSKMLNTQRPLLEQDLRSLQSLGRWLPLRLDRARIEADQTLDTPHRHRYRTQEWMHNRSHIGSVTGWFRDSLRNHPKSVVLLIQDLQTKVGRYVSSSKADRSSNQKRFGKVPNVGQLGTSNAIASDSEMRGGMFQCAVGREQLCERFGH
jgi:hypothetical protein